MDLLLMLTGVSEVANIAGGATDVGEGVADEITKVVRGGVGPVLKGEVGVARAMAEVEAEGGKVLGREVTVETAAGRARVDFVYEDAGGRIHLAEAKNGPTARLNPNQKAVYTEFEASGGRLVGAKANQIQGGYLPPTPVRIFKY